MAIPTPVVTPGNTNIAAPVLVDRELCMGDSLQFFNANTDYFNLLTNALQLSANNFKTFVPTGAVMGFYLTSAPSGWRDCDGTTITNNGDTAALFALIGATLPNLQGQFIRGLTTNLATASVDPLSASRTLGSTQAHAFKAHNHGINRAGVNTATGNNAGTPLEIGAGTALSTSNGDGGTATETRPVNIALRYCIKL